MLKVSIFHRVLGLPTSTIDLENAAQTCPKANMMEAIPRLRVPLPRFLQFVPSWQKQTSTYTHTNKYLH